MDIDKHRTGEIINMMWKDTRCPKCRCYLMSRSDVINERADSYDKMTLVNYYCPNRKCEWNKV